MENPKQIIVGTAGHIDHGKSSLILALTGTDPDRWAEEKRRGITIDLGFAFLDLGEAQIGFVDVPGHERFVRNMLAGVGGIDLVLLVVAADESIKPQTREHFDICKLLGIQRGIVVLTKSDAVDADVLGLTRLEVEDFVRGSFLEGAPIVAVSSKTGAGLEALKGHLLKLTEGVPGKDLKRPVRLPVDRSFAMKGFGTVVTGTLIAGTLKVEDEVEIYPGGKRLRVRGLHSGGKHIAQAVAGQRTAVNLAGVEHREIERGMVLAPAGIFAATKRIDARITMLGSAKALKNRARVHFHQGTAETLAEVILLDRRTALAPGENDLAQLVLGEPVFLLPGDRFIFRQFSPVETIGGGVVLDASGERHKSKDPGVSDYLVALESRDRETILGAMLERASRGLTSGEILRRTGWTAGEIDTVAGKLVAAKRAWKVTKEPMLLASARMMTECATAIGQAVEEFHKTNPLLPGIPKQDLLGRFKHSRVEVMEAALADLVQAKKLVVAGDVVRGAGREVALTADEAKAKGLIEREFEVAGLTVPGFAAVLEKLPVDSARAQKILQILVREKVLVKIAADLIFHQTALVRLRELLIKYRKEHGEQLPIAAFKELTGVSRKYAIPLLEHLDRERVTRRVGDQRVIL
jgi:selenocysteine-specific elongation factor